MSILLAKPDIFLDGSGKLKMDKKKLENQIQICHNIITGKKVFRAIIYRQA